MSDLDGGSTDRFASRSYRYYALGLMTAAYTLNFLDRQVLAILQEPIKRELGLSDGELGLLTGFAFAVFYTMLGIPIARWADRGIRRNILALALGTWSLMTTLSGLAQSYWHLLLARIGVGVGEAGSSPSSYSMISDIFPRADRATALATCSMGLNFGILAGFLIGGWVNDWLGWRAAFFVAGVPGLVLALLLRLTLTEPPRRELQSTTHAQDSPALVQVLRHLCAHRSFRHMLAGSTLLSFAGYGMFNWMPSFLARSHAMSMGLIGTGLAAIIGIGGAVATVGGGYVADRLGRRDMRWYPWVVAATLCVSLPLVIVTFLARDGRAALLAFAFPGSVAAICTPLLMATAHNLVSNQMRAMASAIVLCILNLVGLGLGPLSIGLLSDHFAAQFGTDGLRRSMLCIVPVAMLWALLHFLFAARHISGDMFAAPQADERRTAAQHRVATTT